MPAMYLNRNTPLRVIGRIPLPVRNALRDVEKDWYKVFGYPLLRLSDVSGENQGEEIVLDLEGSLLPERLRPAGAEAYTIAKRGRRLVLAGADVRGAIYALYRLSSTLLGVDPLWYFNDFLPERRTEIPIPERYLIREESPAFRYRGWFINDEDLLGAFYHNETFDGVMSSEGFNVLMEALLRCHGNMIVPGSFAMPDEEVRRLAAARGVILNDHHVTPLGLNMYRWPDDVPFSYSHGKEQLHAYWRTCIDALKDYEQVWTVSFRGKNDHPYWQEDPYAPATDEGRAAEIGEAINTQIRMIREVCPDAVISFNMYNEQAEFYKRGLITLPEDVIRVWPGAGSFSPDAPVRTSAGDGVYFHLSNAARNRYTEQVSPERVFTSLSRYYEVGATSFCLFNVSNTRHLTLGITAGMDYVWNAKKYARKKPADAAEDFLTRYCRAHYGEAAAPRVQEIYHRYFALRCLTLMPRRMFREPATQFGFHTPIYIQSDFPFLPDQKQTLAMQGTLRMIIRAVTGRRWKQYAGPSDEWYGGNRITHEWKTDANRYARFADYCTEDLAPLLADTEALFPEIPVRAQKLYLTLLITQEKVLLYGARALSLVLRALRALPDREAAAKLLSDALQEEDAIFDALHEAEYGRWSTWYETERFSCHQFTRDLIENTRRALTGEAPLPMRYVGGYRHWLYFWDKLYEYQHDCAFPLLGKDGIPKC